MLTEAFPRGPFVWVVGNHPPRRCGIATFTSDLADAIESNGTTCKVAAMDDGSGITYSGRVELTIKQDDLAAYIEAADHINRSQASAVFLQHEFGIFGGEAGSHVVTFLRFLEIPVVTTLHTVLDRPSETQRSITEEILSKSERVVVMSQKAKDILRRCYGRDDNVVVIPHGVPSCLPKSRASAKAELGWKDKEVILTFGLLSPDKGIETMIRAMATIRRQRPDAIYVVAGQTHPHIRAEFGEGYRESLESLCRELDLGDSVRFINRFTELEELCTMLTACDLYVTPYRKMEQITSGTLSYAVGLGRCVVSTPYWHAEELLSQGPGRLIPVGDVEGFARTVSELLGDDDSRHLHEAAASRIGKSVRWPRIGAEYLRVVADIWRPVHLPVAVRQPVQSGGDSHDTMIRHLIRLTDDTGLIQHATYEIPNRLEGYCTDDNCRALTFLWASSGLKLSPELHERLERTYLSFVLHAWNPHSRAFRNFMSYDRAWLEVAGSPDSQARTLVALAQGATRATTEARRKICSDLYKEAWPERIPLVFPRTYAQMLKAAALWIAHHPNDHAVASSAKLAAQKLVSDFDANSSDDWRWFEPFLTYDNARLPEGLLAWAGVTDDAQLRRLGLEALGWLCRMQTRDSFFAPVGNQGFWKPPLDRAFFDQQPVESWATVDACREACRHSNSIPWLEQVELAISWFYGRNALGALMVDPETGACSDGLERHGPSRNQGAESCLSFLGSVFAIGSTEVEAPAGPPIEPTHGKPALL